MRPDVSTFVINLDASTDRWATLSEHLSAVGLDFTRIDGVDETVPADTNYDIDAARRIMGREMMPGEIGCALSHRKALAAFLGSDTQYGLILEDDARLCDRFPDALTETLDWLEAAQGRHWKVLHLGNSRLPIATELARFGTHRLFAAHYAPMGAYALLWTRQAAQSFLARSDSIDAPFDNSLQNWLCRDGGGLAVSPRLAFVSDARSMIDTTEFGDRPKRGGYRRTPLYGLRKQQRLWTNRFWAAAHKMRQVAGARP